jgi:DNA repair ATPase RecN
LGRSLVQVDALEEQERVQELAAMLGGPRPSERMLAGARELLARARRWKEGLST